MSADERLRVLKAAGPDAWIAFSEDESELVAQGSSFEEVVNAAQVAGQENPIIAKNPSTWSPLVLA